MKIFEMMFCAFILCLSHGLGGFYVWSTYCIISYIIICFFKTCEHFDFTLDLLGERVGGGELVQFWMQWLEICGDDDRLSLVASYEALLSSVLL